MPTADYKKGEPMPHSFNDLRQEHLDHNMNGRSGPPPLSPNPSEWSGFSHYQNGGPPSRSPGYPPNGRNNIVTPPMSGSSTGTDPRMSNGMPNRAGGPSPPHSIAARSSYGTTMSSSDTKRRQTINQEDRLAQHYAILKRFLGQSLRDEKGNMKPNRARDKLLRLSGIQFQELSTDVYDELLRRQSAQGQRENGPGGVPPYLLPKDNFHPKRNQARQKLATLPPPRFRDLATDVFYELERRIPHLAGRDIPRGGSPALGPPSRAGTPNSMRGPGYGPRNQSLSGQLMAPDDPYGRPTAKQFQSNTIIPNKSTMVEDDDDDGLSDVYASRRDTTFTSRSVGASDKDRKAIAELETQVTELQDKIKESEDRLRDKDLNLARLDDQFNTAERERKRYSDIQSDIEDKLQNARGLNQKLQAELDRVRAEQASSERDLRSQIDAMTNKAQGSNEWRNRFEGLERTHQELQSELSQQETVTNEVKQEATGFLGQMKSLSERSAQAVEREEQLVIQVQRLEHELGEWRDRYALAKTQAEATHAPLIQPPDTRELTKDGSLIAQHGAIKDIFVTKFQIAIEELLRSARSGERQRVLQHVRTVVLAVRNMTMAVQSDRSETTARVKAKISATANNLITAAKNYAMSEGLMPVALLDAAASHLSTSIIELLRIVKMRRSAGEEVEDDTNSDIVDSPADYYGLSNGRSSVGGESAYSTDSKPQLNSRTYSGSNERKPLPNGIPNGMTPRQPQQSGPRDVNIEELKNFLDSRTDILRSTLQNLVSSIRTSAPPPDVLDAIASITSTTSQIIHQTNQSVPQGSKPSSVANSLSRLVDKLEEKGREGEEVTTEAVWKEYVNGLPPIGFEIARGVKELGQWIEEEVRGGDFS
ncbi:uncharacterized protein KY384_001465 [Bacidia gigantensis]|uniref:uncharacterized protein n=1 Tax=Bacidia gigantensis TaxID=2732470 RepID=UPI001D038E3B|nr:uncharacterized protein KY384_001465 [Bacidia gigantensis]KAG8533724.1 hypothetical protein KY384_001465 [Bacidia gigantensis]